MEMVDIHNPKENSEADRGRIDWVEEEHCLKEEYRLDEYRVEEQSSCLDEDPLKERRAE